MSASPSAKRPKRQALSDADIDGLLQKLRSCGADALTQQDYSTLTNVVETWAHVNELIAAPHVNMAKLRRLFGIRRRSRTTAAESQESIQGETDPEGGGDNSGAEEADEGGAQEQEQETSRNRDAHGRRSADQFGDVLHQRHHVHTILCPGDECPSCVRGSLCKYKPSAFTTIAGRAPLVATRHTVDGLQCSLCKAVFKAPLPEELEDDGVGGRSLYAYSAVAIVCIYRVLGGMPMHRQQNIQKSLGVHVPDASIWDMCERLADVLRPIRRCLEDLAKNARVFYGDDTGATVLSTRSAVRPNRRTGKPTKRTGCHTTCVIAVTDDGHEAVIFTTGIHHTGEVMDLLLEGREADLPPPVFMGDCVASNTVTTTIVLYAGCNAHAVRRFKAIATRYPEHTDHALQRYKQMYDHETTCKREELSDDARRDFHRQHSRPLLREITEYGNDLIEQRKIEPNSDIGEAFEYVINNERRLSAFCRHPGAPIDDNRAERALRICVRLRDSGRFFRNPTGAGVADTLLTVGATAMDAQVNLFDYFVAVQRHAGDVRASPHLWLPWRFTDRLGELTRDSRETGTGPPP